MGRTNGIWDGASSYPWNPRIAMNFLRSKHGTPNDKLGGLFIVGSPYELPDGCQLGL